MKKTLILILTLMLFGGSAFAALGKETKGPFGYNLYEDINRNSKTRTQKPKTEQQVPPSATQTITSQKKEDPQAKEYTQTSRDWEKDRIYYPNATLSSAIQKYKNGNYSGSLQELISLAQKDAYNPLILYYLGMAYTQVGNQQQAINAYEAVINMHANSTLTTYATKGRDCLTNGPTCPSVNNGTEDDLDKFINSPYGNGLSDEINQQMKEQQLRSIEKRIKSKDVLEEKDLEKIQKFDNKKGEQSVDSEKIAMADTKDSVSNEDVLAAIETLKKAGVTVSVNPYQNQMPMNDEYAQLSMMLGSNNSNNNNSMMNMLPILMTQNNGQIDPQVIQSMMMNSMLPDFTFNDKKDY